MHYFSTVQLTKKTHPENIDLSILYIKFVKYLNEKGVLIEAMTFDFMFFCKENYQLYLKSCVDAWSL